MQDPIFEEMKKLSYWQETASRMIDKECFDSQAKCAILFSTTEASVNRILTSIEDGTYEISIPSKLELAKIGSTKKRVVYVHSLQDRLVLGVLYRVVAHLYKSEVNHHVFSYRKGVKTLTAVESLLKDKSLYTKHGLKCDISAYFNSVDKHVLRGVTDSIFKDSPLHPFINTLLYSDLVMYKGEAIEEYMSLIPGCAFSSFLANYCLKDLDDYLTSEAFRHVTYARYSDDMLFFTNTKEELEEIRKVVIEKLSVLGLSINPSKYEYFPPGSEITFLGLKFRQKLNENNKAIADIDVGDVSVKRLKKVIKCYCKEARKEITTGKHSIDKALAKAIDKINTHIYKSYVVIKSSHGWAYYVFRNINTTKTLRELDFYLLNTLRWVITGKNNKANARIPRDRFTGLGLVSFIEMFNLYKMDFDMYRDYVQNMSKIYFDK